MIDENKRNLSSQTNQLMSYTVLRQVKCRTCKIHCLSCNVCIHMYSCTGLDALLKTALCEHGHFVHMTHTSATNLPSLEGTNARTSPSPGIDNVANSPSLENLDATNHRYQHCEFTINRGNKYHSPFHHH